MVPSAGARFNLNTTVMLLQQACRDVTVSLRKGNTLVTKRFMARNSVSERTPGVKLKFWVTVRDPAYIVKPPSRRWYGNRRRQKGVEGLASPSGSPRCRR